MKKLRQLPPLWFEDTGVTSEEMLCGRLILGDKTVQEGGDSS